MVKDNPQDQVNCKAFYNKIKSLFLKWPKLSLLYFKINKCIFFLWFYKFILWRRNIFGNIIMILSLYFLISVWLLVSELIFFKKIYCYSITVVCLFSPSLHPTPAKPTSLLHLHPPPWFCPCVLYSSMDGTGEHYAKWNKPGGEGQIPYDLTFSWTIINKRKM